MHHLQPVVVKLVEEAVDKRDIAVRVSYHSHVYSKGDSLGATGLRFTDEGGKYREFCPTRYASCLGLPDICKTMIQQNFPTWVSRDKGESNNLAVSDAQLISGLRYVIFYNVWPSLAKGVDVELVVKSAFEKNITVEHIKRRERVKSIIRKCHFEKLELPKQ